MTVFLAILSLFFTAVSLYLSLLTVASFLFRKRTRDGSPPLRLAVLIPAHNEALQIRDTIESVRRSRYPESHYRIIVIADNCTDETAGVAEGAGAQVLVRSDPVRRGKGQALDWFLREQQDSYASFEGIAMIDADTEVEENFLQEISASLSHPEVLAVQGFYGVANPTESWRTALMTAALAVFHHVRPAGRNRLGGSAGLKGNGMAFRTSILQRYGWPAHSVVEDLELGIRLLLDGIVVHYNPDAVVRAEMAATRGQAETQRRRWEGGRLGIFAGFAPALLRSWISRGRFCYLDGFMDLLIPPLSALCLALIALATLSFLFYPSMAVVLGLAILCTLFYVVSGLVLGKAPPMVWLYLAAAPFFVLWKAPLYLRMLAGGSGKEWIRTKRKAEIRKQ